MRPMTLATVTDFCGGKLQQGQLETVVYGVSTDTRSIEGGDLFVALHGDNFDGHAFIGDALKRGAKAVMVDAPPGDLPESAGLIRVVDTLSGLQMLARRYREYLDPSVIGITGSNGKTSTKDMVASVLETKFSVNATKGNLNNHIGLPLTILETLPSDDYGVFEMGMNHPGEIEMLADIALPDIGIITNVGIAHIEFMKTREAIAKEKGMLAEAVPRDGHVILNAEDDFTPSIADRARGTVVQVGFESGDFRAEDIKAGNGRTRFELAGPGLSIEVQLPMVGRHMVLNALMAAATGKIAGLTGEEIKSGLESVALTGGRLQLKDVHGIAVVDDSYNANPDSMRAAVDTLAGMRCDGKRFAVLGGMAELGETAEDEHRKLGGIVRDSKIDVLVSVGDTARPITEGLTVNGGGRPQIEHFESHADCAAFLRENARPGDLVLVKGSRSAHMENVIDALEKEVNG